MICTGKLLTKALKLMVLLLVLSSVFLRSDVEGVQEILLAKTWVRRSPIMRETGLGSILPLFGIPLYAMKLLLVLDLLFLQLPNTVLE